MKAKIKVPFTKKQNLFKNFSITSHVITFDRVHGVYVNVKSSFRRLRP